VTTIGRATLLMTTDSYLHLCAAQVSSLDLYDQLGPDGPALHTVCCMEVAGPLDRRAAELATHFVGSAHPLLSAKFCAERALATAMQPQCLRWLHCADARVAIADAATSRFSLGEEPALRVVVAQDSTRTLLLFVSHAVACDRRSTVMIASEWARAYRLVVDGQAPDSRPSQPPVSSSEGNRERSAQFWRTRLMSLDRLELPNDLPAEATWRFADRIEAEYCVPMHTLRQAAARHRVSVFAMLVTVVVAGLARIRPTARRHVLFSLDGRADSVEARDVGPFSTAAVISVSGTELRIGSLADEVKHDLLTVLGHRRPPMDEVLPDLDPESADRVRAVLGGVVVDFRAAVPDLDLGPGTRAHEVTVDPAEGCRPRSLALGLEFDFAERDSLVHASLAFNPALFSAPRARAILGEVSDILRSTENGERTLA
jgi:Condensation domain